MAWQVASVNPQQELRHGRAIAAGKRPTATFERAFEQFVRVLRTDAGREVPPSRV